MIAGRIGADRRLVFPHAVVSCTEEWAVEVRTADGWWGSVGTYLDATEEVTAGEVEHALALVAEDVADTLRPDERTDPWPDCPSHQVTRSTHAW